MSKEMFLGVLREHLKVLEDQEQQDILQEYAQHIDIKMQNGLSEEEAIRDFGPVKELAAEILEAYHVKPEFGEAFEEAGQKKGLVRAAGEAASEGGRAVRKAGNIVKEKAEVLGKALSSLGIKVKKGLKRMLQWITKPFKKKEGEEDVQMIPEKRREEEKDWTLRQAAGKTGRFFGKLWRGFLSFVFWILRFFWNVFCIGCSVLFGLYGLLALFGLGAVVILCFQGYPLRGIVLICLGGILCGGAACMGCISAVRRKERASDEAVS